MTTIRKGGGNADTQSIYEVGDPPSSYEVEIIRGLFLCDAENGFNNI